MARTRRKPPYRILLWQGLTPWGPFYRDTLDGAVRVACEHYRDPLWRVVIEHREIADDGTAGPWTPVEWEPPDASPNTPPEQP